MPTINQKLSPPFCVVEVCLGHAFGYGMSWTVQDVEGKLPWAAIKDNDGQTVMDEAWCRAAAKRLNAGVSAPEVCASML